MNRYKEKLIQDKTLPPHNFITNELLRRHFIRSDDKFTLYMYDYLFEQLMLHYDFKTVIVATNYVVTKVKKQKFCDEEGNKIESLYAYFRTSITFNLRKITNQIDFDWLNDDYD